MSTAPSFRCLAVVFWLATLAAGFGEPVQQATVNISGLIFRDKLTQSANSLPSQVEPARAYSYVVNATVHGTGLFASVIGNGTSLGAVLNLIQPGSASGLAGIVPNLSGTLPLGLVNLVASGSTAILGTTVSISAGLALSIDPAGTVTVSISDVSVLINGKEDTSDTLVVDPGSTITVAAILPPVATSNPAGAVTPSAAVISGSINPKGAATTASLHWGIDSAYADSIPLGSIPAGLSPVPISTTLGSLTPATVYHYAFFASNLTGTSQSADATFQTGPAPPPGAPSVTTDGAAGINFGGATLDAIINPNGFDTTVVFQYGHDTSYGFTTVPVDAGAGTVSIPIAAAVDSLQAGHVYHFRPVGTNTNGVIYGLDETFQTTGGNIPTIVSGSTGAVGINSATLYAVVSPNGAITTVSFDYGPTGNYGSSIPVPGSISGSSGQVSVSGTLTGLQPGAIYHFRIDADNSAAPVSTADQLFATTSVTSGGYQGKYSGLILGSPAGFSDSGLFTVVIDSSGGFSASGSLGGKSIRFAGAFGPDGAAVVNVRNSGITAHLQLAGSGSGRNITGSFSGSATSVLSAALVQSPATAALFTIRMPHPASPAPQGNGYGSLKISSSGLAALSGKLGDGTPVTCGSLLLNGNTIPLYALNRGKTGGIVGNILLETSSNGDLDAALTWFRPGAAPIPLALYGSAYTPPARDQPVIGASTGDFIFTSGAESFTQSITLSASRHPGPPPPNPHKFKATITPATGLFTGAILDPATGKSVPFGGAFFQDTNLATGLFQTKPSPGEVDFQPSP